MKAAFLLILLASLSVAAGLAGCESDLPPDPSAQNKLQRGLSGQGAITQPGKAADAPFSSENTNAVQ